MQADSVRYIEPRLLASILYGAHDLPGQAFAPQGVGKGGIKPHQRAGRLGAGITISRLGLNQQILSYQDYRLVFNR